MRDIIIVISQKALEIDDDGYLNLRSCCRSRIFLATSIVASKVNKNL
jgi:hypothetical protein